MVIAGKEYGSGSSRDWAAKGTLLLGVRAVDRRELRAHPPLEPRRAWASCRCSSRPGENAESLGLTGHGDADDPRPRRRARAAPGRDGRGRARRTARRRPSPPPRGSTRRWTSTTTGTAASCRRCCGRCSDPRSPGGRARSRPRPRLICFGHGTTDLPRRGADGDRVAVPARGGRAAAPRRLRDVPGREGAAPAQLGGARVRPGDGRRDRAHPHPPRPHRPRAAPRQAGLPGADLLHAAHAGAGRDPAARRGPPAAGGRRVPQPQGPHEARARAAALRRDGRAARRSSSSGPCPSAGRRR